MKPFYNKSCLFFLMTFFSSIISIAQWLPTKGPGGGEVKALFQNNKRIFAGTLTGGMHVSDDDGKTWQWINSNANMAYQVFCFVLNNGMVFAGTTDGVYGSADNGDTWTKYSTGLPGKEIKAMVVKNNVIYAAANSAGLYKSTDNGKNWTSVQVANYQNPGLSFLYVD